MSATEARTDDKAGWCSRCRQGTHALCASPPDRCACPGKASHPNRPTARPQEATVPAAVAAARPIAAVPAPTVRWEDPPEVTRGAPRKTFSPDLLRELESNPGRWARVDDLKAKSGALSRVTKFKKGHFAPVAPPLWEAVGRRTPTGSAFYLRFVGPEA